MLHQLRSENGPDGAGVDRAVGVAAGLAIDRAGVHAGRAADALEGLALPWAGKDRRTAVVEQNHMEALRAVAGSDAGPERGVGVHALAGGRARQQLQHHFEVLKARQHFFDAGQGNHGAGQGEAHAAVALRLDHGDRAGFSDQEVCAADGRGNGEKLLPQIGAGGVGEGLGIVGEILEAHAAGEDLAHLTAIHVQGRNDDVGRLILAELQNDFGQVGFEGARRRPLQGRDSSESRPRSWS